MDIDLDRARVSIVSPVRALRARGIPAELVIGVRKMPFFADAWVELNGAVVHDDAEVERTSAVMERCRP